jgi:cyanophycin synthetase
VEAADIIEEALSIPIPASDKLVLDDTRRLTGPGLLWDHAGAVLDILFEGPDADQVSRIWTVQARRVLDAIGWSDEAVTERFYPGGANLAISAPLDQLYSATFAAQTAWHFCAADLLGVKSGDFDSMICDLKSVMQREANPALITLVDAAVRHQVEIMVDDDELSLGHGCGALSWPVFKLPATGDVPWDDVSNLPVALITGTNGKTTSTRLACAIARAAGKMAGLTSTEMVSVGDDILDRGDYSGPGGARLLLRDKRLDMGFLEVARGGILRRGLPVRHGRAALVTNIAADHLGQFGINTVEDLARVKMAVHRSLAPDGVLILNADDAHIVELAAKLEAPIWWFSMSRETPQIRRALTQGQPCGWVEDDVLVFSDGERSTPIMDAAAIPITMNGAARYNTMNALGAACLSIAMGLELTAIRDGLSQFQNNPTDNPGRCNEFQVKGGRVFVDFAHNPHSIEAVITTMAAIPADRRFVMLSQAGDRDDQAIRDVTASALAMKPDFFVASDLPDYLRGREPGEVSEMIRDECLAQGLPTDTVTTVATPADGARQILQQLRAGDLALLLVLSDRDQIFEMLQSQSD